MKVLTTKEAAQILGVSVLRVQQLIWQKRLLAQKVGRDYIIQEADLDAVRERPTGRPKKTANAENAVEASSRTDNTPS